MNHKLLIENWRKYLSEAEDGCVPNIACNCVDSSISLTISDVQNFLGDKYGRDNMPVTFRKGKADGICGPETRKILMKFQVEAGVRCDACVGPETFAAMKKDSPDFAASDSAKKVKIGVISTGPRRPIDDPKNVSKKFPGFKKLRPFRDGEPKYIIIHESGSYNYNALINWLKSKGLGVHYIVQRGMGAVQLSDLNHGLIHTPGFNSNSIGIEFNHNYHGTEKLIKARWYWKNKFNIPQKQHLEDLYQIVKEVCSKVDIPFKLGMLKGDKFSFAPKAGAGLARGVLSHKSASGNHGDGTYQCLYMALRQKGHSADDAYNIAYNLVTKTKNLHDSSVIELPSTGFLGGFFS